MTLLTNNVNCWFYSNNQHSRRPYMYKAYLNTSINSTKIWLDLRCWSNISCKITCFCHQHEHQAITKITVKHYHYTNWKESCVATVCLLIVVVAHKIELGSRWCHVKKGLCQSLFGELFIKSLHFDFVINYRYFNFLTHVCLLLMMCRLFYEKLCCIMVCRVVCITRGLRNDGLHVRSMQNMMCPLSILMPILDQNTGRMAGFMIPIHLLRMEEDLALH